MKTVVLFVLTALCEIIGCYSVYAWLRLGRSIVWLVPGAISLGLFAWLLTLHPSHAGRVYASYGGVYVAVSVFWLWAVEKQMPDTWDWVGTVVTLCGMAIIAFGPHRAT